MPRPLIAKGGQQLFRVSATADWAEKKTTLQIYSVTAEGKKTADHATCTVRLFDCAAAEAEWKRVSYLVKRSIDRLHDIAEDGDAHRLGRGMVYKLFAALVDYDENFKNIREVILDSEQHEATARVKFQASQGKFHRNPFWIDSFGHLSGFIMNASDATDSKNQVFVNHGWDSMRCLKKFSPDVTYRTYVRMQPWKDSIWAGDVYVFDGEDIVAVYGAVKVSSARTQFQKVQSAKHCCHSSKPYRARSSIRSYHPLGLRRPPPDPPPALRRRPLLLLARVVLVPRLRRSLLLSPVPQAWPSGHLPSSRRKWDSPNPRLQMIWCSPTTVWTLFFP